MGWRTTPINEVFGSAQGPEDAVDGARDAGGGDDAPDSLGDSLRELEVEPVIVLVLLLQLALELYGLLRPGDLGVKGFNDDCSATET